MYHIVHPISHSGYRRDIGLLPGFRLMWSIGSDSSGRHFVSSSRQVYLPSFCCIRSFTHDSIAGSVLSISLSEIGKSLSTSGSAGRVGCPFRRCASSVQ